MRCERRLFASLRVTKERLEVFGGAKRRTEAAHRNGGAKRRNEAAERSGGTKRRAEAARRSGGTKRRNEISQTAKTRKPDMINSCISGFLCSPQRTDVMAILLVAFFARASARRSRRFRRRTVGLLGAARTRSHVVGLSSLFLGSHFHFLLSYLRNVSLCRFTRYIRDRSVKII